MKRLFVLPLILLMAACGQPQEATSATGVTQATHEATLAPASGKKFKIVEGQNYFFREWQHPGTGCWYLIGTGEADGIIELNNAQGQICESTTEAIAR